MAARLRQRGGSGGRGGLLTIHWPRRHYQHIGTARGDLFEQPKAGGVPQESRGFLSHPATLFAKQLGAIAAIR